jgi:hypothetical protein
VAAPSAVWEAEFARSARAESARTLGAIGFPEAPNVTIVSVSEGAPDCRTTSLFLDPAGLADGLPAVRAAREQAFHAAVVELSRRRGEATTRVPFVGELVDADDRLIVAVLDLPGDPVRRAPQLSTTRRGAFNVSPSLVHATAEELLHRIGRSIASHQLPSSTYVLGDSTSNIVRSASERFVRSVLICCDDLFGADADLLLNAISALPYEGRAGAGTFVLAAPEDPAVNIALSMRTPVPLSDARAVRKLMEASDFTMALVVGRGGVRGFGTVQQDYDEDTETVFQVRIGGRGVWDLLHGGDVLLSVRDGVARLPAPAVDVAALRDLVELVLPDAAIETLVELASAAQRHAHGAMLIFSSAAASEAERLAPQAWRVMPAPVSPGLLLRLTAMDGAVLLDLQGQCHAIGVILDGQAMGWGDPARGSRFNNAQRYLDTNPPPAVIVIYSTDGGIDVLPKAIPAPSRLSSTR